MSRGSMCARCYPMESSADRIDNSEQSCYADCASASASASAQQISEGLPRKLGTTNPSLG